MLYSLTLASFHDSQYTVHSWTTLTADLLGMVMFLGVLVNMIAGIQTKEKAFAGDFVSAFP